MSMVLAERSDGFWDNDYGIENDTLVTSPTYDYYSMPMKPVNSVLVQKFERFIALLSLLCLEQDLRQIKGM